MRMRFPTTVDPTLWLVLGALALGIPAWGAGETTSSGTLLEVIAVDPASPATLKAGEKANVKIRYHCATAETVRIWAQPNTKGSGTPDGFYAPSSAEPKGPGEVDRFVGAFSPAQVDELRVSMVDAETEGQLAEVLHPVNLKWEGIVFGRVNPVGRPFPDLAFTSIQGQDIDVAKMKGKVVLVSLWSMSIPLRLKIPHLLATYENYHTDGFEILGINLDMEMMVGKTRLRAYIKEKRVPWPQYYDGKDLVNNEVVKSLGLTVPLCSYLIDRQGVVRYFNIDGEQLGDAVAGLIAEGP